VAAPAREPATAAPAPATERPPALSQLFGFAQYEFAGTIGVPDGRYLAREGGEQERQRVLVVETLGAPPPPSRRRRQPRPVEAAEPPEPVPLTRVTAVFAYAPFASEQEAGAWLEGVAAEEERLEAVLAEATLLLNTAVHAGAVTRWDPRQGELGPEQATQVRVGFGSGDDVASGRFAVAREVDLAGSGRSRRRRREDDLRPQERLAAVLGARERLDSCETLLLRARADVDAGRLREAALQLRVALDAFLLELAGALQDPGHEEDMAALERRRGEAAEAAEAALRGDLDPGREQSVRELVALAERVLRRRRVLLG
jgi:hypothetical protein